MQLDDQSLRQLIMLILSVLRDQNGAVVSGPNAPEKQKTLFAIFTAPWDNRFYAFADCLKRKRDCRLCGFVSPDLPEWAVEKLRELAAWETIRIWDGVNPEDLKNSISVFPVTSRDTIVKTALCISDTFETKWIRAAMEQGGSIVLPRRGFERFTGSEPEKYKNKVLSYYRDLLEMNIELPGSFEKYRF
ncbi:hypothetical protein OBV_17560 [Oscillibacter valericigenes Sjm18-20]|nr:hypothetical protein OBV_17560 [Oscillibacter valericigenes Sjm18-20]